MRKALFLDRDGVVNVDHGYIGTPDRFEFVEGIFDLACRAQESGYRRIIVTNQSGVAHGYYTRADYDAIDVILREAFTRAGTPLDAVYACFEAAQGTIAPYARESFWRKPNPGMLLDAIHRFNLDPARSVMVGDKDSDMEAAEAAGIGVRVLIGAAPCERTGVHRVKELSEIAAFLD